MSSKLNLPDNFGYLDTETTGLSASDQVIEISLIKRSGEILFNSKIKPSVQINPFAQKVHKITNEDLEHSPSFLDVYEELNRLAGELDTIYAYGEVFDRRLLLQTYTANNLEMPNFNLVCAHKMALKWMATNGFNTSKSNLDTFAQAAGANTDGIDRHRSLGDCLLMKRSFDSIESGHSMGISSVSSSQPSPVQTSTDIKSHIKNSIDECFYDGIPFDEYNRKLNNKGVKIIPLISNSDTPTLNACYYSYNKVRIPGSKVGKKYSAPALIKRGLDFNHSSHKELIINLFLKGKLEEQKNLLEEIGENIIGENFKNIINITWPLKSVYEIKQRSRVLDTKVNAVFSSFDNKNSPTHYGQFAIDEKNPNSIKLKELKYNEIKISLIYADHLSDTPSSSLVSIDGIETSVEGERCVSKSLSLLSEIDSEIALNYFKGNITSEIMTAKQNLFCDFLGNKLISLPRFIESCFADKCSLYPRFKSLITENSLESRIDYK